MIGRALSVYWIVFFALIFFPEFAAAQSQNSSAEVTVRFGIHDKFDRIVFDWPGDVGYRLDRAGDVIKITFDRPSDIDVETPAHHFGDHLKSIDAPNDSPSQTYQLNVASKTTFKTFDYVEDGIHRVVVDVAPAEPLDVAEETPEEVVITTRGDSATSGQDLSPEGRYQAAFERMLADPSDAEASFNFVEAATAMGDVRGAIAALERILLVNPNLDNIKMELGVLYRQVGADELAQSYLGEALESEDMPDDVRKRADQILQETEIKVADTQKRHRVNGSLFLGGRYETNANAGPGSNNIRLFGFEGPFLDDEDTEQEDFAAVTIGNLDYAFDFGTQADHALELGLFGLVSRYKDETDVNTSSIDGDIGPRFFIGSPIQPWASVRPFATASYLELDDDQYRTAYGGGINARSAAGPVGINVTLQSLRQDFSDTTERPTASDQTGWYSTIRPSAVIEPTDGTLLGAGLVAGYNNADEDFESFVELGANVFVTQELLSGLFTEKPISVTLGGRYRHTNYEDPDIQVDPDTEREDDRYDITLSLDAPVTDYIALSLSGQQTWNESNLPNNEYDNTAATAGLTFNFGGGF